MEKSQTTKSQSMSNTRWFRSMVPKLVRAITQITVAIMS